MEKEEPPELGSSWRAMLKMPRLLHKGGGGGAGGRWEGAWEAVQMVGQWPAGPGEEGRKGCKQGYARLRLVPAKRDTLAATSQAAPASSLVPHVGMDLQRDVSDGHLLLLR